MTLRNAVKAVKNINRITSDVRRFERLATQAGLHTSWEADGLLITTGAPFSRGNKPVCYVAHADCVTYPITWASEHPGLF